MTDEAVDAFQGELTSRVWKTERGSRFLRWFWKTRLGCWLSKKFEGAEAPELHGYAYWGPVALAIAVTEILGALSPQFRDAIPWPTISGTVGHAQDVHSAWGLAVVAVIAATAFYAVLYVGGAPAPGIRRFFFKLAYGWPLVLILTVLVAVGVRGFVSEDKIHLGYAIYGSFALFGIVIPMILVWRKSEHVVFPNLFYTFRKLRERFRWVAMAVIAGLAILVLHLALYPWPNLAREPAKYAGLNAFRARASAERALMKAPDSKENLVYSTQGRGISEGRNAWFVYFNIVTGGDTTHTGCVVIVTEQTAVPTDECRK